MRVIIEGLDNSGKSTLAKHIQMYSKWDWIIQESEGPAKNQEELKERIDRYDKLRNVIFARHPAVSQPIYNLARPDPIAVDPVQIRAFYEKGSFFIYCEAGNRGLAGHAVKDRDTPEHLAMIWKSRGIIASAYRDWAWAHANIIYRIGDDKHMILKMVEAAGELS